MECARLLEGVAKPASAIVCHAGVESPALLPQDLRPRTKEMSMTDDRDFDVVVVGAGPAGCVLANRLTEDPGRRGALLEAGPDHGPEPAPRAAGGPPGGRSRLRSRAGRLAGGDAGLRRLAPRLAPVGICPRRPPG